MTIDGKPYEFTYSASTITFQGGETSSTATTIEGTYIAVTENGMTFVDDTTGALTVEKGAYAPGKGYTYTISSVSDLDDLKDASGKIVLSKAVKVTIGEDAGASASYFEAVRFGGKTVDTADANDVYYVIPGSKVDVVVADKVYDAGKLAVSYTDGDAKVDTIASIDAKYWGKDLTLVIAMADSTGAYTAMQTVAVTDLAGQIDSTDEVAYSVNGAAATTDAPSLLKVGDKVAITVTVKKSGGVEVDGNSSGNTTAGTLVFGTAASSNDGTFKSLTYSSDMSGIVESNEDGTITFKLSSATSSAVTIPEGATFTVTYEIGANDTSFAPEFTYTAAVT